MIKEYRFAEAEYDEEGGALRCRECSKQIGEGDLLVRVQSGRGMRWVCGSCASRWAELNGMPSVRIGSRAAECYGAGRCACLEAVRGSELLGVILR